MKESSEYNVIYDQRPLGQRVAAMFMFWIFLAFMVWLSQGSTWWTFFFGLFALVVFAARILNFYDKNYCKFYTKAELLDFVNSLPDEVTDK